METKLSGKFQEILAKKLPLSYPNINQLKKIDEKVIAAIYILEEEGIKDISVAPLSEFLRKKYGLKKVYPQFIRNILNKNHKFIDRTVRNSNIFYSLNGEGKVLFIQKEEKNKSCFSLVPGKHYGNLKLLSDLINSVADDKLIWVDKYFNKKALDILYDIDFENLHTIKIMTTITSINDGNELYNINDNLRNLFTRFQKEFKIKNIDVQLNILIGSIPYKFHDRWLCSDKLGFNFQSLNSFFSGSFSEIYQLPPEVLNERLSNFDEWWTEGLDIINDWDKIKVEMDRTRQKEIQHLKDRFNKLEKG